MPVPETHPLTRDKFLNTLAESYVLHESILNSTDLSVVSATADGIINSINASAERLLGYTADELIGKPLLSIHDQTELRSRAKDILAATGRKITGVEVVLSRARGMKASERGEWTYVTKDGKRVPVSVSLSAIRNDGDEVTGFLSIAADMSGQRKIDQELTESRNHLQALIQSLDDIAFEVDQHGNYINVWTSREDLLFAQKNTYAGRNLHDVLKPSVAEIYTKAIPRVIATGKPETVEHPSINAGSDLWYSAKITRLSDERVLILVREITERKKAELALIESEKKFRLLTENVPGVIYLCRNDEKYSNLFVSANIEKITGHPAQEFLGNIDLIDVVHPDDKEFVKKSFVDAVTQRKSYALEYRIVHKSGEIMWVKESGAGLYGEHGLELIEGYISDITKRKNADFALLASEQKFRLMAENIPAVIYLCNNDEKFSMLYLNSNVEQLTGYAPDEFIAGTISFVDLFHPEDAPAIFAQVNAALERRQSYQFQYRLRDKRGNWRWVEEVGEGVYKDNKLDHLEGIITDISERKKAEEALLLSKSNLETAARELQEQNRQSNEFAHIISHNLRSPARNIQALISLLNEKSTLQEYKDVFDNLKKTSGSLAETLEELLDILKVKKEASLERTAIPVAEVLDKVKHDLLGEILTTNAKITTDFSGCGTIHYYKPYLESILLNLLSNAIKYRDPQRTPEVHFKTSNRSGRCFLEVTDNGLGIDLARHGEQLFGLRKVFHDHKESRGVGLFLTKTQIETMGGRIWAESTVGVGSSFFVSF
jgi:PAS domain S-box-containing protein